MNAIARYWHNFFRWVKHGHAMPLRLHVGATGTSGPAVWTTGSSPWLCNFKPLEPIPVESWAERKAAFERAKVAS